MTTEQPPSTDDALGQILRQLNSLRSDVADMREKSDSRHRSIAYEMGELRAMSQRAIDIANDAKRLADQSAHTIESTQRAVVEHTRGLAARQASLETAVEGVRTVNVRQSQSLDELLAAETERKTREDERERQDDRRWKWIGRAWPIITAGVALASYLIGHWKP